MAQPKKQRVRGQSTMRPLLSGPENACQAGGRENATRADRGSVRSPWPSWIPIRQDGPAGSEIPDSRKEPHRDLSSKGRRCFESVDPLWFHLGLGTSAAGLLGISRLAAGRGRSNVVFAFNTLACTLIGIILVDRVWFPMDRGRLADHMLNGLRATLAAAPAACRERAPD